MYKVFYNKKVLLIYNKPLIKPSKSLIVSHQVTNKHVNMFLNSTDEFFEWHILTNNPDETFQLVKKYFYYIEAAGGLVINKKNELLVIKRLGIWDLPKGKIESNESPELAAAREVEEECGISNLMLKEKVDDTFHIYSYKDGFALKKTYWFKFYYSKNELLIPQVDEHIEKALFVDKEAVKNLCDSTYSSLKLIFSHYLGIKY